MNISLRKIGGTYAKRLKGKERVLGNMDFDALKRDLMEEDYVAYFSAGFGGALVDAFDIESMTNEELLLLAEQRGVDIRKYQQ